MKRLYGFALAVMLVLGMAVTAFSEETVELIKIGGVGSSPADLASSIQLMDKNGKVGAAATKNLGGEILYIEVTGKKGVPQNSSGNYTGSEAGKSLSTVTDLKNFRIFWKADEGRELVESVQFVTEKATDNTKHLYLAIALKDFCGIEAKPLDLFIALYATDGSAIWNGSYTENNSLELSLQTDVGYATAENISTSYVTVSAPVVSFAESAGNVVLCFEKGVEISGSMSGQRPLFLRLSTTDKLLGERYPDAELRLFDGNYKLFRHNVTLTIPASSIESKSGAATAPYLYDISDGKPQLVDNVAYSTDDERFTITTKMPGRYLVSGTPLTAATNAPPPAQQPPATASDVEPNPQTGAPAWGAMGTLLAVLLLLPLAKRR